MMPASEFLPSKSLPANAATLATYLRGKGSPGYARLVEEMAAELQERRKAESGDLLSRMRMELSDLETKLEELCAFVKSPSYGALSAQAQAAITTQVYHMRFYADTLHYRIRLAETRD